MSKVSDDETPTTSQGNTAPFRKDFAAASSTSKHKNSSARPLVVLEQDDKDNGTAPRDGRSSHSAKSKSR